MCIDAEKFKAQFEQCQELSKKKESLTEDMKKLTVAEEADDADAADPE